MEKYFRQIAGVFRSYKQKEQELNNELEKAQKSGNYSSNYLSSLASKNRDVLKEADLKCCNTLSGIREELRKTIVERNDLLSRSINPKLQALLDSGIVLELDEWKDLALKCKDNIVESRLLHDRAAAHGVTLNNYISTDEALKTVDRLISGIENSMYGVDPIVAPVKTVEEAEQLAGQYWHICTIPSFDCFVTPKTLEEEIERDYKEHSRATQPSDEDGADFLQALGIEIDNSTLDNDKFMDADEVVLRKERENLEKSKEKKLKEAAERFTPGSYFYKQEEKRIEAAFSKAFQSCDDRLKKLDEEKEQCTKEKLENMKKSRKENPPAETKKEPLSDNDRAFLKGLGKNPDGEAE